MTRKLACETGLELPFLHDIKDWCLTQNFKHSPEQFYRCGVCEVQTGKGASSCLQWDSL